MGSVLCLVVMQSVGRREDFFKSPRRGLAAVLGPTFLDFNTFMAAGNKYELKNANNLSMCMR